MFTVRILDATDRSRVWLNDAKLSFDPRLSAYIRMRDRPTDVRARTFRIMPDQGVADIVLDDLEKSRIIVYVTEVQD